MKLVVLSKRFDTIGKAANWAAKQTQVSRKGMTMYVIIERGYYIILRTPKKDESPTSMFKIVKPETIWSIPQALRQAERQVHKEVANNSIVRLRMSK